MSFDVALINRVGDEIEASARRLKENVNAPAELNIEIQKIESSLHSLKSLAQATSFAGENANTTQLTENQNQM